jgi:NADPH-dependent glutamate synthase beta subunit-like oxidoreductase/NAD-dependent dihydropyrimidine dehydrogenase PreA subunit
LIEKKGVPPCTATCPAGINVHGYVALIAKGKFQEALDLVTETVAFPRVLGRVCPHPCESKCTRGLIDKPVSICALKRFAADSSSTMSSLMRASRTDRGVKPSRWPTVAIIGSGPAGLTAARDLARMGHRATVFEALPVPGGMVTVGMPRFRLPREIRKADIEEVEKLGIEIRTSTPIGEGLTLEDLKSQGYQAILIATGAHKNRKMNIPGEGLSGILDAVVLLQALNLKQPVTVGKRVAVIGGGYTAVDSARSAIRMQCDYVTLLYRRSQEEMPANAEEVAEAHDEGVEIQYLVSPIRILGKDGKVTGVECQRMALGEADASGRRRPVPIPGSEFVVEVDTVVVAVGQRPDLSFLGGDTTLTETARHIIADPHTMATKVPGIFAAGDCCTEPSTMIEAVAAGKRAAISIDKYLRGEEYRHPAPRVQPVAVDTNELYVPPIDRQTMPCLPMTARKGNFEEVDLGLSQAMAMEEAKRCLNCASCSECLECVRACELNAVEHKTPIKHTEVTFGALVNAGGDKRNLFPSNTPGVYSVTPSAGHDLSKASAVASRVIVELTEAHHSRYPREESLLARPLQPDITGLLTPERQAPRVGVFVCGCGGGISNVVNIQEVVEHVRGLKDVVYCNDVGYACTDEAVEIKNRLRRHNLNAIVVAACSCCSQDQICFSCSDRRIRCKANLLGDRVPGVEYEFVNIREHCAWVHQGEPEKATAKALSIIRAGIARVRTESMPLPGRFDIDRRVLVVGNGLGAIQATHDLVDMGFDTTLVGHGTPPKDLPEDYRNLLRHLKDEMNTKRVALWHEAQLLKIEGKAGRYKTTISLNYTKTRVEAGAIVVELSGNTNPTFLPYALANTDPSAPLSVFEPTLSAMPGIFFCGASRTLDALEAANEGSTAASKAAVWLSKGLPGKKQTLAMVDETHCRGCGTCVSVCPYRAVTLDERRKDVFIAHVADDLCRGCGICVARCPSNALNQGGYGEETITSTLQAILS